VQISPNEVKSLLNNLGSIPEADLRRLLEDLDKLEVVKDREDAATNFMHFVKKVWPHFIEGAHHKRMARAFERVARGELKRLIINMPPRHTKSEFASYLLPAWFLGNYPGKKVIQTSHTAELAVGFGRKVRKTSIQRYFRELAYRRTLKLLGGGRLTLVETISLSVWGVLSRVKARISSLLTTLIRNKKPPSQK
jgi:hypothetical protein